MGVKKSEKVVARSEKKIGKAKPITLLSILCALMALLLVMTFVRFPIGIKNFNGTLGALDLDYDIDGGVAYTLTLSDENIEEVKDVETVLDTLRYRMSELGYDVFSVKALKSTETGVEDYEIRIEAKQTDTLASDISVATAYGELAVYGGTAETGNPEILTDLEIVEKAEYLGDFNDGTNTSYIVGITFTEEAYDELSDLITEASAAESSSVYYMGVKLGETQLMAESVITMSYFNGRVLEVNANSETVAKQLALQLNSGGLAYQYDVSDGVDVSSPYGDNVALKCLLVVLAILVIAFVYFAIVYRGFGLIMSLSLLAFALLEVLMLIAVPGVTLSIGGVIGIALSIIVVAVSLMFIANSVKREFVDTQKTVKAAVKKGFKDMTLPIVGAFVACAIVAGSLFIFATGGLACFAITFGIGSIIGIIASLVFSRMFSALLLPISGYSEKFLGVKRVGGEE